MWKGRVIRCSVRGSSPRRHSHRPSRSARSARVGQMHSPKRWARSSPLICRPRIFSSFAGSRTCPSLSPPVWVVGKFPASTEHTPVEDIDYIYFKAKFASRQCPVYHQARDLFVLFYTKKNERELGATHSPNIRTVSDSWRRWRPTIDTRTGGWPARMRPLRPAIGSRRQWITPGAPCCPSCWSSA